MHRARAVLFGVGLALALGSCVAPARSFSSYEGKAAATAEDAASAAETAILTVKAAAASRAFAPTVSVSLSEAEKDASAVQGTFDSIQPPDARSDRIRSQLDGVLDRLSDVLSALRIAARRGELEKLPRIAAPLPRLAKQLQVFAESHS